MRRIVKFCALGTPYGKSGHPDFIMWMTDIRLKCGRLWLLSLHLSESSFRKKRRCFKLMTTLTLPLHRFKIFTIAPFYENVRESKNTILELNWVVLSFVQVRLRRPTLLSMHEHNNFFTGQTRKKGESSWIAWQTWAVCCGHTADCHSVRKRMWEKIESHEDWKATMLENHSSRSFRRIFCFLFSPWPSNC